jgi:hypothetical protein
MSIEPFLRLPAKPVNALIAEISALQDRVRWSSTDHGSSGESIVIPDVTLLLDSGHSVVGSILRVLPASEAVGEALVLIRRQMDATYLPIGAIRAVTVHYSAENLHLLSGGKIKVASGAVPSRLDLERQVRSLSAQLNPITVTVAWDEMVATDEAFQSLEPLIKSLAEILLEIQADDLGVAALQQVDRIAIRFGTAQIIRRDRVLEIGVAILDHDLVVLAKVDLRQAIDRAI